MTFMVPSHSREPEQRGEMLYALSVQSLDLGFLKALLRQWPQGRRSKLVTPFVPWTVKSEILRREAISKRSPEFCHLPILQRTGFK